MKSNFKDTEVSELEISAPELKTLESPFAPLEKTELLKAPLPANNTYGLCSIENFSATLGNGSNLTYTHDDAQGFHNYMNKFYTPNFWFKDGGVQSWQYEEPYDHWQNLYGVDAVMIFYHSGHGNMDSNGVFQAPMGGKWGTESWFFSNHKALFANQRSRYIFWSTCYSCRVLDGQNPVRTWWNSDNNPGFRMLFGFETVSIDSPNYGAYFWNHWKNNEAFSTAWLNASWDIYHNQSPSCVASGSNQTEASNRLFNERLFTSGAVARNWYQWRWYYASSRAARNLELPRELKIATFETATFTNEDVQQLASTLRMPINGNIINDGTYSIQEDHRKIALTPLGHLEIKLAEINRENKSPLDEKEAIKIAKEHIEKYQLHAGEKYELDLVRISKTAGSKALKGAKIENEFISDTTVQFRQIINGIPAINSDAGLIRVTIDNDGTVVNLNSSVKKVASLNNKPKAMVLDPKDENSLKKASSKATVEKLFKKKLTGYKAPKLIKDSEEIGYDVAHAYGRIVIQRVYEVSYEKGLKKLIKVIVPYFE